MYMFKKIKSLFKKNIKPGLDIEIIGKVGIVRVNVGHLPPQKANIVLSNYSKLFTKDVKESMGLEYVLFVPYSLS